MAMLNFYDEEEILKPSYIAPEIPEFPEIAVGVFSQDYIERLRGLFPEAQEIASFHLGTDWSVYRVEYEGKALAFYLSPSAAPGAAWMMENLISSGAKHFLVFGSAGTIDAMATMQHYVIPDSSLIDEGTASRYVGKDVEVLGIPLNRKLCSVFDKLDVRCTDGRIWSTDAIFRETPSAFNEARRKGCVAVDMETSALSAVAVLRKVDFARFAYTDSELDGIEYSALLRGPDDADVKEKRILLSLCAAKMLYADGKENAKEEEPEDDIWSLIL